MPLAPVKDAVDRRGHTRRALTLAVAAAGVALAHPAAGDDGAPEKKKKKPGLFDFGGWESPVKQERNAARELAPGGLDLSPASPATGEPRVVRLRVYADRDYRGTVLRWQTKAREQIGHVNRVVGPVFGVTFEIESFHEWDRSHAGATFDAMLDELEALDPAREVDWVLGLVTPFRGVASSIHQIGGAHLLARHFVLRGMDDEQEALALDREFKLLSPAERLRLYDDRKAHKEIVVFLHEWAHTMGALHNEDPAVIMNPAYRSTATGFSGFEKHLLAVVLDRRLARRDQPLPEADDLGALLDDAPAEEGSDKERAALLDLVRQRGRRPASRRAPGVDIPAADVASLNAAIAALNAGRSAEAWTRLEPLVRKHPRQAQVAALACPLVAGQPHAPEAASVCEQAMGLAPDDLGPALDAANAHTRAGELIEATPYVMAAAVRAKARPPDAETRLRLARLALAVGAFTAAETALAGADARAGDGQKVAADVQHGRRRAALPADAARWGVTSDREPAYTAAFREALQAASSDKLPAARARAAAFATAFPDTPGADVVACDLELRAARGSARAGQRCEAALAKFDEATVAHYLLGTLAARTGRDAAVESHLRRAIQLDPESPDAWRELARHYRATRASQRLSELRSQHQALLSSPLPE